MKIIHTLAEARHFLKKGKLIAYPTEAVYGLGCDPFNQAAVERLFRLKQRDVSKGLILLISSWEQLALLTKAIPETAMERVKSTWPGPTTWIFPKADCVPDFLNGHKNTIAVRMSAHPIAHGVSLLAPVVSTSANLTGQDPAKDSNDLIRQFPQGIDACLRGKLGEERKPSAIYEVLSGECLR